ncbi:HPr family phosphocarrier protein [Ferrimonas lipolytica]|uniref:Phosphocarrier protein HPr n=1 Tax=Ferrimonas lipolytica TaxID=2724191 RepID=A0A6H1UDG1_9GAMM|nr:HPr family phosphocarrier protein [Ferrimonas lipolytica]QIZ76878.1 HPr family phosphocarrier protein [Ferrimonas lipolytica]
MYQRQITITAPHGIHTRPAALLVRKAQQFKSEIVVACQGEQANAKSLFRLQMLNLSHGAEVNLSADGEDEQQAVEELVQLLETLT